MMWRDGDVLAVREVWGQSGRRCAELEVRIVSAPPGAAVLGAGEPCRAIAYESVTGLPEPGEWVRLEVSALARGLGTGGHGMVTARPGILPADPEPGGHLVKARYMPDQVMVTGVDEQNTPLHSRLSAPIDALTLAGAPVVIADLHSSLPAILAGLLRPDLDPALDPFPERFSPGAGPDAAAPPLRVAYVMTDGGALPLPYSRSVAGLQAAGVLVGTVSVGQSWGGDLEAVSIHNGLLAARLVLEADVIVVTQGPGNLGTDTPWGFSGVACGDAVNAAAALGGRPVACLRVSQADARLRHRGVSHHSITAYGRVAMAAADVVVPELPGALGTRIAEQAAALCGPRELGAAHRLVKVAVGGLYQALADMQQATGVRLSTMGRGLDQDEAAFLAAAAAGRHAARLVYEPAGRVPQD
ncbi:DUF3866 family protein [Actinomyces sp. 565]|uniref:DUF3866 family protein n=1 Tax=Actinomyces sp. 565 TaxID=2057794 RepID=UPI0013A70398|nr:DUF3866 family protein [Actinomyces sp. 565]NDR52676.1 DUF3866 family protein [Actinomyces sp. 565]